MTKFNNIVIIAHNSKKPALVSFLKEREDWLWGRTLLATGLTAEYVEGHDFKVPVIHVSRGKDGGYRELTDKIINGEIRMVIFFKDPEIVQSYHEDIVALIKACNANNIPLATNPASAELLILGMIRLESVEKTKTRMKHLS